ncbi:hypothetical protein VCRA2119O54_70008 [Vibrio crassostreae]|nr:hypothetical protein VCRA2118O41_10482 [Vibrio crassostreae]CAK1890991.1 hypothetical protein VCRA2119O46_10501 [Vibrio crassostreae]CAK1997260.1 hypothetical protein VCRA2119O47_20245 [Vibrio crassostreae]CAK2004512.1 hypothetical protein VCRA2119O44_20301 [Vibrio crassostreae]CAK2094703.1 hypothetical protein VCRA2116O31_40006 [Vibrio crassostreae]
MLDIERVWSAGGDVGVLLLEPPPHAVRAKAIELTRVVLNNIVFFIILPCVVS